MHNLAIALRAAQFTAHAAHNLASGETFFADHEALGDFYGAYESAYDSVIERMIGRGIPCDIGEITTSAAASASAPTIDNAWAALQALESSIQQECRNYSGSGSTPGTDNLLAQIADDSEVRAYKIGQRMAAEVGDD